MEQGSAPEEVMRHLNRAIERDAPSNRFVTLFLADLRPASHTARCVNAGHAPAPLVVRRDARLERILSSGPPLGVLPGHAHAAAEVRLEPGDLLVACTDGVTELENARGEMFGVERLESYLLSAVGRSPEAVRRGLLQRLEEFASGADRLDDLTLIVLRRDE
jgi:sigma-B regulation protein RsbU (phosphoserine phosphatase)